MKKIILRGSFTGALMFCFLSIFGQIDPDATGYYLDAMRYSRTEFGGGTRYRSIAGAATALGADMGAMSTNPAGIGVYRKSEASVTGGFGSAVTNTDYLNESINDSRINLNISNVGFVSSNIYNQTSGYMGGNWGFSFNRINNFQDRFSYDAINDQNNVGDFFVDITNGIPVSVLSNEINNDGNPTTLEALAYYGFLTNEDTMAGPDPDTYFTFYEGEPVKQQETVVRKGAQYSWDLAYGGNYNNKLFFGVSLAFQTFRFVEEKVLRETLVDENSNDIQGVEFEEYYKANALGFNAKFGLIYKVNDFIRLGGSIHSPTFYRITDEYQATIRTTYNNFEYPTGSGNVLTNVEEEGVPYTFTWNLTTPFRANGGISLFFGKAGFVSADLEYVPYKGSKLSDPGDFATFSGDNKTIDNIYRSTLNLRLGSEWRYGALRFRGGFALYGDPVNRVDETNRNKFFFTGGCGLRKEDIFVDLGIIYSTEKSAYLPYDSQNVVAPTADVRHNYLNLVLTFGTVF